MPWSRNAGDLREAVWAWGWPADFRLRLSRGQWLSWVWLSQRYGARSLSGESLGIP